MAFDRVTFFLVAVALAGVLGLGFVGFSPNRILTPKAIALWNADTPAWGAAIGAGFALLITGALWRPRAAGEVVTLAGAVLLLLADFAAAGATQFGSGWAWLAVKDGKLIVTKTPNGENPLVHGATPVLGCDVWEHSYYIDYRNRRPDYLKAFLDHLVNWEYVEELLLAAK